MIAIRRRRCAAHAGEGEAVDDDAGVAAVLQVDVDAGPEVAQLRRRAERQGAPDLTDVAHHDVVDRRLVEGLDVDTLLGEMREGRAVDRDARRHAGGARQRLCEVDADVAVGDRPAGDCQAVDAGGIGLVDALDVAGHRDAGDRRRVERRVACSAVQLDARHEPRNGEVLDRDVVRRDREPGAGIGEVARRGRQEAFDCSGNMVLGQERALNHHARPNAEDRQRLVDGDIARIGAGRDQDCIAGAGRIDRVLDGGEAAVSNQQELAGAGAVHDLGVEQVVGALGNARRDRPTA